MTLARGGERVTLTWGDERVTLTWGDERVTLTWGDEQGQTEYVPRDVLVKHEEEQETPIFLVLAWGEGREA